MKVRIGIYGIDGQWVIDMPDWHPFIMLAGKRDPKYGSVGCVAGPAFEVKMRNLITEGLTIDILPDKEGEATMNVALAIEEINKRLDAIGAREVCAVKCPDRVPITAENVSVSLLTVQKWMDALEAAHAEPEPEEKDLYYVNIDGGISRHNWIPGRGDNLTAQEICDRLNGVPQQKG